MNGYLHITAMVFALMLGNCGGAADTKASLPMEFTVNGARFTPSDPVAFHDMFDSRGQWAIQFIMSSGDAKEFGDFTKRHIGEVMELRVCGSVVSSPVIQEAIYSGNGVLAGLDVWEQMTEYLANGCP
ncbi:MAG: hypothetical protein KAT26_08870 [Marinosulfonomonas sp.]|nr:hypothetical protein [Marinosulfonomonas sp.]